MKNSPKMSQFKEPSVYGDLESHSFVIEQAKHNKRQRLVSLQASENKSRDHDRHEIMSSSGQYNDDKDQRSSGVRHDRASPAKSIGVPQSKPAANQQAVVNARHRYRSIDRQMHDVSTDGDRSHALPQIKDQPAYPRIDLVIKQNQLLDEETDALIYRQLRVIRDQRSKSKMIADKTARRDRELELSACRDQSEDARYYQKMNSLESVKEKDNNSMLSGHAKAESCLKNGPSSMSPNKRLPKFNVDVDCNLMKSGSRRDKKPDLLDSPFSDKDLSQRDIIIDHLERLDSHVTRLKQEDKTNQVTIENSSFFAVRKSTKRDAIEDACQRSRKQSVAASVSNNGQLQDGMAKNDASAKKSLFVDGGCRRGSVAPKNDVELSKSPNINLRNRSQIGSVEKKESGCLKNNKIQQRKLSIFHQASPKLTNMSSELKSPLVLRNAKKSPDLEKVRQVDRSLKRGQSWLYNETKSVDTGHLPKRLFKIGYAPVLLNEDKQSEDHIIDKFDLRSLSQTKLDLNTDLEDLYFEFKIANTLNSKVQEGNLDDYYPAYFAKILLRMANLSVKNQELRDQISRKAIEFAIEQLGRG
jgi:hypothetical protein